MQGSDPAKAVQDAVKIEDRDPIAMTPTGPSPQERINSGSMAEKIRRMTERSVLLVPLRGGK